MSRRAAIALVAALASACASLVGLRDDYREAPGDAGPTDGVPPSGDATDAMGGPDASEDAPDARDAAEDLDASPYHPLGDAASWTAMPLNGVVPNGGWFNGAVSDGRYLYAVPQRSPAYSGLVVRYDLAASFTAPTSWTSFDVSTMKASAKGFAGGAFDGKYVYLAPQAPAANHGNVTRYDTRLAFGDAASWEIYDVYAAGIIAGVGELRGYEGVVFDGRYVYFVPHSAESAPSSVQTQFMGRVLRYDTQGAFDAWTSWSVFDLSTISASAVGYSGALFDGRYLYLVPNATSVVARYDTTVPFGATSSWSTFSLANVAAGATGYVGGAFDGRHIYFAPNLVAGTSTKTGLTVRYDTTAAFTAASSWTAFDLTNVQPKTGKGFVTAIFDGRYVYYSPFDNEAEVLRFDTRGDFTAADGGAWSRFAPATVSSDATKFAGTVWDGHHVYFLPGSSSTIALRFDARDPPFLPPSPVQRSSFY